MQHLDEELSLDIVAAQFYISKFHFSRIFKEETGESVYGFIKRCRVDQSAIDIKLNPEKAITDIGLDYGYSASNYSSCLLYTSFFDQADAGPDDEQCHQAAHIAVDLQSGQLPDDDTDQYYRRCDDIVTAVCTSSRQGQGVDPLADVDVEQRLPNFDDDSQQQNDDNRPAELQWGRMHDFVRRRLDQFDSDDHDEHRDDHSGDCLLYTSEMAYLPEHLV